MLCSLLSLGAIYVEVAAWFRYIDSIRRVLGIKSQNALCYISGRLQFVAPSHSTFIPFGPWPVGILPLSILPFYVLANHL